MFQFIKHLYFRVAATHKCGKMIFKIPLYHRDHDSLSIFAHSAKYMVSYLLNNWVDVITIKSSSYSSQDRLK